MQGRLDKLKGALPEKYPFLRTDQGCRQTGKLKVYLRGNKETQGEEAPRAFLSVLCTGDPVPFSEGSGRMELAEAIASPQNPLTPRVMVNRIWQHHFGVGLVTTASNFGQLGDRPSHPELLDYLAARFVEQGWSIKAMHREIVLSATYALSTGSSQRTRLPIRITISYGEPIAGNWMRKPCATRFFGRREAGLDDGGRAHAPGGRKESSAHGLWFCKSSQIGWHFVVV